MRCYRCMGMMVKQIFEDFIETGDFFFVGWRCVNCGEIIDPVIAINKGTSNSLSGKYKSLPAGRQAGVNQGLF